MMIPVFRCEDCNTEFYVDIYTNSAEGVSKTFIDMICCPICTSIALRVCFVKRKDSQPFEQEVKSKVPESLVTYYNQLERFKT
ncbi:MAG: hypothetical protein ACTSVY_01815 [Candidatus Helarchaeota archaeon]